MSSINLPLKNVNPRPDLCPLHQICCPLNIRPETCEKRFKLCSFSWDPDLLTPYRRATQSHVEPITLTARAIVMETAPIPQDQSISELYLWYWIWGWDIPYALSLSISLLKTGNKKIQKTKQKTKTKTKKPEMGDLSRWPHLKKGQGDPGKSSSQSWGSWNKIKVYIEGRDIYIEAVSVMEWTRPSLTHCCLGFSLIL